MVVNIPKQYFDKISNRNLFRFYLGLIPRILIFIKYAFFRQVVRFRGGFIGDDSIVSWKLARKANKNLIIGSDCIIQSFNLDLRSKIIISDHVIINKDVSIIRVSHHIDDDTTFSSRYYHPLKIESYCWIATGAHILPSVQNIASGSVIGAYSLLVTDSQPMGVYSGNPAKFLRSHNTKFEDLIVVSTMGGDLRYYLKCRR